MLALVAGALGLWALVRKGPGERRPPPAPVFGISGERPETFADPRYRALGLRHARVQASWDLLLPERAGAARYPGLADERARLAAWLRAARAAGVRDVLLAVKASRDRPRERPGPGRYADGVRRLLGWIDAQGAGELVRAVSPWNEPNLLDAGAEGAERAGRWFAEVRRLCEARGCTPVAGDLADAGITRDDLTAYRRGAGGAPRVWAWHAYEDAWDRERDPSLPRLRSLLELVGPQAEVWLSEQGGIVRRLRPGSDGRRTQSPAQADADLAFLLDRAPALDARITRFYVYQWRGEAAPRWDSGLIAPDGETRPAYCTFARAVGAAARAGCAR